MTNSTQVTVFSATTATPDLCIVEGQITTTSNQIAEHFGKRHDTVLRAIRNIECSAKYRLRNFAESSYVNEQGKEQPCFRMTRNGFVFLAMGFTGKDAALWKEAYIEAFNRMEEELLARTTRPFNPAIDYDRISPAQAQDLKEIVNAIVKAGLQKYDETWARLQKKFRVNSYKELSAARYEDARKYLIAKLPNGYADEVVDDVPKQEADLTRTQAAFDAATRAAYSVQSTVFDSVMSSTDDWKDQRLLLAFANDGTRSTTARVETIPQGCFVTSWERLTKNIGDPCAMHSTSSLATMANACLAELAARATRQALSS